MIEGAVRHNEPLALSAISLIEIAGLTSLGKLRLRIEEFFAELQSNSLLHVVPLTYEIALEVASLGRVLADPANRTIVATARVHHLRLITSDRRIGECGLVPIVD